MRKELAQGLFANDTKGIGFDQEPRAGFGFDPNQIDLSSMNPHSEVRRVEKRLDGLTQEMRMKLEEVGKSSQSKSELFFQKLTALESRFEAMSQDLKSKYSGLTGKMTERNLTDMKTQALMDRHTQLLRQFEQRVSQLQRVVEEQEYQILNYKSALEEARKELQRLKKI